MESWQERVVAQFARWGYDPFAMSAEDYSARGYYEFVLDDQRQRTYDADNQVVRVFREWKSPEHAQFLIDNWKR